MELRITYANGEMLINLDGLFPTSKKNIGRLLRVIRMDYAEPELQLDVERYLQGKIELLQDDRVHLAKIYSDARTKRVELSEKLSRSAESSLKDELRDAKKAEREALRDFDHLSKIVRGLETNLIVWRELCST